MIEAKLDHGRGPVATVLVQRGTLKLGDIVVAGSEWGRVRALVSDTRRDGDSGRALNARRSSGLPAARKRATRWPWWKTKRARAKWPNIAPASAAKKCGAAGRHARSLDR